MTTQRLPVLTPAPTHETMSRESAPGFLASPLGMAIVIPLLIALTGSGIVLSTQALMRQGVQQQSQQAFRVQSQAAAMRARDVLSQADPLLDALRSRIVVGARLDHDALLARSLASYARGRPGVAQTYLALPDGSFHGVYADGDGWNYRRVSQMPDGRAERSSSRITGDGELGTAAVEPDSGFDPRQRPWYRLAAATGSRAWTEPYLFAASGRPGITCTEPVLRDGQLVAVVAVDFDLDSLSAAIARNENVLPSTLFLFTGSGVVLAAPPAWRAAEDKSLLTVDRISDPAARGFFAALGTRRPAPGEEHLFGFRADGRDFGAAVLAIDVAHGPQLFAGRVLDEDVALGLVHRASSRSLWIGAMAVVVGAGAGLFFASHLARSRRETAAQRARAKAAEAKVEELGSYRLLKLLGKGGMGEVWLGEHRFLARPAAIKRILAEALTGGDRTRADEARTRFETEARITAALRSRNTIELYDYGISPDGSFFYVMELLDGCDLRDLVTLHGALPLGRVVHLMAQACNSLAEAHDRGLVHRDIKPENLYTCRRADEVDVLKVLDFGIVQFTRRAPVAGAHLTSAGMVQGTPSTMSPEQAQGEELDGRSDLYALGCVAYYLITGRDVFPGDDPYSIVAAHLHDPPPPLTRPDGSAVPEALAALVLACLAKDRAERPADARVLAERLLAIELPLRETWSQHRMRAWWQLNLPPATTGLFAQRDQGERSRQRTVATVAP